MPFLSGSSTLWAGVISRLKPRLDCLAIDLPGFGDAAQIPGYTVDEMAAYVASRVASIPSYILVGHSMAGKVSLVLAQRLLAANDSALCGVILLCASPPSPEPMQPAKRQEMKSNLGQPNPNFRQYAEDFIRENATTELPLDLLNRAVDDVLRMNLAAWNAWLDSGSREDWSNRIAPLNLPALVIAGEQDPALGPAAQAALTLPYLPNARLEVVPNAAHLIPIEQPAALATLFLDFAESLPESTTAQIIRTLPTAYQTLIDSDRVSLATRTTLLNRLNPPETPAAALTPDELATLQILANTIAPAPAIPYAATINLRLARGTSKGWRYAKLPPDLATYRLALAVITSRASEEYAAPFAKLSTPHRREIISLITSSNLAAETLTAAQIQLWFEDLCAEVTAIYIADPATLAAIGYSGIADGANSTGFTQIGLDNDEDWEPAPAGNPA